MVAYGWASNRDQPDTWRYDSALNAIDIVGSRCTAIHNATAQDRLTVEIGVLQIL